MAYANHFQFIIKISITTLILLLNFLVHINSQTPPNEDHSDNNSHRHSHRNDTRGRWEVLQQSLGIVAMHMAVTRFNTVVMFDQTSAGPSQYQLPRHLGANGTRCPADTTDPDCFAHSIEFDIASNQIRPLRLDSDPWWSSGAFIGNGTLVGVGGNGAGARRVRYYAPCEGGGSCDWREDQTELTEERWYAAAVALPEEEDSGRIMVVGGRGAFSYEFVPKRTNDDTSFTLPLLTGSNSGRHSSSPTNLYPFVHLSSDGNLFIFANRDSILFNYKQNHLVRTFPRMPGHGSRTYPSSGSSVILPLDHSDDFHRVEVMICGGSSPGAYRSARRLHRFSSALRTCGRLLISDQNRTSGAAVRGPPGRPARWRMERMPAGRVMGDMVVLPTGEVLIVNGARNGAAGWDSARNASRRPFLYRPEAAEGRRFSVLRGTKVARMYRSSAVLLPDGRVLVGGSNPHSRYRFDDVRYPSELRLQAFVPHYMDPRHDHRRPTNVAVQYRNENDTSAKYGEEFSVTFSIGSRLSDDVEFTAYAPPFTTHSVSMNQRMLRLRPNSIVGSNDNLITAVLEAPPNANVAPPGYYMLTVLNSGIPSVSKWIRFTRSD